MVTFTPGLRLDAVKFRGWCHLSLLRKKGVKVRVIRQESTLPLPRSRRRRRFVFRFNNNFCATWFEMGGIFMNLKSATGKGREVTYLEPARHN